MLEWAVTSSVLILVVLALRRLLMGKISLRLQYGLWALVLVRLLVPVSFGTTALSILNLVETANISNPVIGYMGGHTIQLSISEPDPTLPLEEQQEQYEKNLEQWQAQMDADRAENGTPISLGTVLLGVWAAGAVILSLWLLWANVRFAQNLRRSRSPLAVDCPLPAYVTGAAQTPCLFGLLHPSIYVTEEAAANETVLRHSLAHELTHFHHRDHIWAALRGLCLALHWYNPLVWLAAVLSRRDGELCCDEATVKRLGEGERAAYGRTLLAVTCQGHDNPLLTATSMTGSGNGIKERIVLLAKRPKTALYTLIAVILIAVIAMGCTFTGAPKGALLEDAVLHKLGDGLTLAIPADIAEELLVEFPDEQQQEPSFPYVYHRASYQAGVEDFGSPAGFLFNLFRYDQVEYEQSYLAADGGTGQVIFARDDQWYYGMGVPTDVQFYTGSGEIDTNSPEYQRWEYILSRITDIQADFAARNGLTLYDASADLDRPFLWEGEHRYVECRNADGSLSLTLLLSQPATQGDGGIWCVEGSFENKYGVWNKELPLDIQIPVSEYYENLQTQVDEGHRPGLLDPVQAAMDWYRVKYDTEDLSGLTFTLLEGEPAGDLLPTIRRAADQVKTLEHIILYDGADGAQVQRSISAPEFLANELTPFLRSFVWIQVQEPDSIAGAAVRCRAESGDELLFLANDGLLRMTLGDSVSWYQAAYSYQSGPYDRILGYCTGLTGDPLTQEELEAYRQAFSPEGVEGGNPVSAFFTSYYERPEKLNFEEFLRYLPDDGYVPDDSEDPEFQALTSHPLWPFDGDLVPTPIHRYTRQIVDEVLEKYAGLPTAELSGVGMDTVIYLEEYDAWYNFTSDYGPGMFIPAYGMREGSTVTLWELPSGNGTPGDVLTLEETADGFRILSHLPGP